MYFPFDSFYLATYWEKIVKGDAFYTCYIEDINMVIPSKKGLSYNKNIKWHPLIKSKYEIGFIDPYFGGIIGVVEHPIEIEERNNYDILPLDITKEIDYMNLSVFRYNYDLNPINFYENDGLKPFVEKSILLSECEFISFSNFKKLLNNVSSK